jgi:hypothetical protein
LVGILFHIRRLKLAGEEDEKLRDAAMETKKGRSAIAVVAQISTFNVTEQSVFACCAWNDFPRLQISGVFT